MGTSRILRPVAQSCAAFALACGGGASALGLGEVSVDSSLNERFAATIPLLSVTRDQRDSLSVHVARIEDFQRAGIEWTDYMSTLRFRLLDGPEGTRVVIDSDELLREPYLNFVVEAYWGTGRLLREYTVLLDPPKELNLLPSANRTPVSIESFAPPAATARSAPPSRPQVKPVAVSAPPPARPTSSAPLPATVPAGELFLYGPVRPHEQPRAIAARLHPGPGVTQEQVELALYRANPQAFRHGRLDRMVPGAMLSIPPLDVIRAEDAARARAIILEMRARLELTRSAVVASPQHVAARTGAQPPPAVASAALPVARAASPVAAPVAAAAPAAPPPAAKRTENQATTGSAASPAAASVPTVTRVAAGTVSPVPSRFAAPRPDAVTGRREWASLLWLASAAFLLIGLGALLLGRRMSRSGPGLQRKEPAPAIAPIVDPPAAVALPQPNASSQTGNAMQAMLQDAEFSQMYGRFTDATRLLEAAVATAPQDQDLRFKLAEAYFAAGMRDDLRRTAAALEGQLDEARRQKLVDMLASLPPQPAVANTEYPGPLAA
jgi:pilus assembly protein FimV